MIHFGKAVRRREDFALLTGTGAYVADLVRPDMAAMRVIRSPLAHARIKGIDFSSLVTDPDCLGFLSAADLPDALGTLPAMDLVGTSAPVQQRVLAQDTVRYAGEPVAVVLAKDEYLAEDLA